MELNDEGYDGSGSSPDTISRKELLLKKLSEIDPFA
jgi:hypothetical protein